MTDRARKSAAGRQRALVVGISDYPAPIPKLPAVAADVREIAKLLRSKEGAFPSAGVTVLTEGQATRKRIEAALQTTFAGAYEDETVFVYLAGHGGIHGGDYFFIAYDTDGGRMAETGVALTEIKDLFEKTPSQRVFLWLDFCHSGGILRSRQVADEDRDIIRRTLGVVQGHGKVILAACTSSQSAYEDPNLGHGLFTHALLRGLQGEAASGGEVTSNSLFDFIDREVGSQHQRPMYFGKLTGRIVLMHYKDRGGDKGKKAVSQTKTKGKAGKAASGGTWVMLGEHFYLAQAVRQNKDSTVTLEIAPASGEQEADLATLRPSRHGGGSVIPFAFNNEAHAIRVREVETEAVGGQHVWRMTLAPEDSGFGSGGMEATINTGGKSYSPGDIARLRAGRILLNDPPPRTGPRRGYDSDSLLEGSIEGSGNRCPVRECPIRTTYTAHRKHPQWKQFARLRAVYFLKASGTVDHILELSFGAVRSGQLPVKFRGRRQPKSGYPEPTTIELSGSCPLE